MNKEQFEKLELEQQVEYINKLLETLSLTKACANVGIARKTLSGQFERAGYKLDKTIKKYVKTGNSTTSNTREAIQKEQEQSKKANNIKVLENRIGSLEKELEQLKAIVLGNTSNTINTIDASDTRAIKKYESDNLVSRNYKIDREVAEQFVKFCKMQKLTNDYKVSDLATNALVEFMKTFKD
ncbi:hypothetical protein [Romboutsia ilealis]|uniref:hypothetical protein n=1 Tax=Romboutsia ilealis TaxID=1115758 RepID=UPI0025B7A24B|nr:hypothetical protein [Romboutsia ilealis]